MTIIERNYRLYAIWNLSKRESRTSEAVKYFAALVDVIVDEPTLFSLLGQANEACGDPRSAAEAYRHKAALQGTAKEYVKLGDFCFRHPGLDAMAVEAYQTALKLNPFYYQARKRLALLRPSRFSPPGFITGHHYREDLARDLCEAPRDHGKAEKLQTEFVKHGAIEYAETTYRLLQSFHPEQSVFVQDLTQVYLACGKPQLAWIETIQALARGTAAGPSRAELEAAMRQAEQEIARIGEERPSLPAAPIPQVESVAPTIATDWYLHKTTATPVTSLAETAQLVQEHLHKARQALVNDVAQLRHFLTAASLYQHAGQSDEALDCLVSYGQAMGRYHRTRGKANLARDLAIEAMRLAVSQAHDMSRRQTKLVSYVLDYFEDLEKGFGAPRAWPEAIYAESKALLVDAAGYEFTPPLLRNLLTLIEVFLSVLRQPAADQDYLGPIYRAAVIRRRAATILQVSHHKRLSAMLKRWVADAVSTNEGRAPATTKRAQLRLLSPQLSPLQAGVHDLELRVTVKNSRDTPADCIWVTLKERRNFKATEPRQFIPFLPGGTASSVAFELTTIPDHLRLLQLHLSLSYFDPVDLQRESISPVLVLRPEEQRDLADEIWECLSKAIEVSQAYQADKATNEAERAMGFRDPQFFRREARYLQERRTWLSEARKKLVEEYEEERRLLDLLMADSPEQTIREALKTAVRSRGLDETQFQQISGDGGDILSQVALYIRNLTTLAKEQKGGEYLMAEWISILKGAAEIAASAKTLGGVAGNVFSWFENLLRPSDDQRAKKVWEDFKQDPERNKDALAQVAMRLKPDEDPILKGYVLGVARQNLQANRGQVLILLSGPRYTHSQVIRICRRLDPATPGLGRDPSQQDAAAWAVNHAATQKRLEDILIRAMVEINPEMVTEIVKLI